MLNLILYQERAQSKGTEIKKVEVNGFALYADGLWTVKQGDGMKA